MLRGWRRSVRLQVKTMLRAIITEIEREKRKRDGEWNEEESKQKSGKLREEGEKEQTEKEKLR